MTEPRDPDPKVEITIHKPTDPADPVAQAWLTGYMNCRNCGRPMVRGTQCPTCKAWCR